MLVDLKIGQRLILLLMFIMLSTLMIVSRMGLLSDIVVNMYNHPFTVSNAVLRVDRGIIKIHRSMKDVALAESFEEVEKASHTVDNEEEEILKNFDIISKHFLGDKKMYEYAIKVFKEWRPIRDEVIFLVYSGNKSQAAAITKGKGAHHVEKLSKIMLALNGFAQNKAADFLRNAKTTDKNTFRLAYFFVSLTMVLGIIFVYFFTRSIVDPLSKLRIAAYKIGEGNLDVRIEAESKSEIGRLAVSFNEMVNDLRNKTTALKCANKNLAVEIIEREQTEKELATLNETLEVRVQKRTEQLEKMNKQIQKEVTVHKRMENELRLQSEILLNMSEGVCLVRVSDHMIVYANPEIERIFGYNPGELCGKNISDLNYSNNKKTKKKIAEEISEFLNKYDYWQGEISNIKKDGTQFWCYENVSTFNHSEFGKVFVSVHQDITERKLSEEKLNKSLKEKETLLQEVHHRVKNNMQVVSSLLNLQARRIENPQYRDIRSYLGAV